jgi:CheY-like chemotaxis protein/AraC-like DNA-binding protein
MLEETKGERKHETYRIMHTNVLRLLSLINQILDLSKLEHGLYNIKVSKGDIIGFLKGIVRSFGPLMEQKNIGMRFLESKTTKNLEVLDDFYFDKDVIEKIMNNLLSNAIKFTPANGRITICICIKPKVRNSGVFEIFVKDNGIGIPADKLPYIYERFYQVDASSGRAQEGSGVGLAFVKELVAAHKGTIGVKSKLGVGTTFRVQFPIGKKSFDSNQIISPSEREPKIIQKEIMKVENHPLHHFDNHEIKHNPENPMVLIIEDHEDVRTYIRKSIEEYYNVIEASNAAEGILLAIERIPDLIISDVMMPEIDGFECCRTMKSDAKTSHIPVILLTAKATENDKLKGLELGADDYLTKPFSAKELLARIKNLIEIRSVMRDKFSGNAVIKPGEISVSSADRIFIEKLVEVVESNISREDFGVEDLGAAAGMSQSQLHRKLKSLINQTGNHFIRSIRMHRAKMLLERDAGNITEVAFMVGYGDPGYFTKNFRNFFGILPSEVKNKYKQN